MLKTLYARFVLWLIRPALELRLSKIKSSPLDSQQVIDVMLKDLRRNGPISRAIRLSSDGYEHRPESGSR
ncbi:hypothetical protein [Pusillimonas sp. NJUB218]|uniref:hypothetical protein n=1 Tax=Pusillimonas sp. NJUB218 TaxID=2023230 RepID=UPI000F4C0D46|nr:hypothetical protein [Pusillimonas sp. NJUB218]